MPKVSANAKPKKVPASIRVDLTGQKFGKITVLGFWKRTKDVVGTGGTTHWLCQCDCGVKEVRIHGNIVSQRYHDRRMCRECLKKVIRKTNLKYDGIDEKALRCFRFYKHRLADAWKEDVHLFVSDCFEKRDGKFLVAVDGSKPIGPGNFEWTDTAPYSKTINIKGTVYSTQEASKLLGVSRQRVQQIRKKIGDGVYDPDKKGIHPSKFDSKEIADFCVDHCGEDAAKHFKCSRSTILKACIAHNVSPLSGVVVRRKRIADWINGNSPSLGKAASKFKCSENLIIDICREHGIELSASPSKATRKRKPARKSR